VCHKTLLPVTIIMDSSGSRRVCHKTLLPVTIIMDSSGSRRVCHKTLDVILLQTNENL
jgi:hypothetical protein